MSACSLLTITDLLSMFAARSRDAVAIRSASAAPTIPVRCYLAFSRFAMSDVAAAVAAAAASQAAAVAISQSAVAELEAQQKQLKQRQKELKKEVKKKKQAEKRLMTKAAANLTQDQLLQVLAIKAAAKAKAKAKGKA